MSELVTLTINDGIATIAMDDGKANALSSAMFEELNAAFDKAEETASIVLFKGRDGMFSGGFDLKELAQGPDQAKQLVSKGSKLAVRILSFPTPVIAVSTGHCIAMGAFLMLACDYRLGTDGPFRIGLNETMIGMTLHNFGIELARYRLPANYFNRCLTNAEIFSPADAIPAGFYDRIAPASELASTARATAQMFQQLKMPAFTNNKRNPRRDILKLLEECIQQDLDMPLPG